MTIFASWRCRAVALGLVGCLSSPAIAFAQDDTTRSASARALFEQGVELADEARWDEAADRFERALDMRYSSVIAFNLATALEELGQVVAASEVLRQASLREDATTEVREAAEASLERLAPRIAHLTVNVTGDTNGATVLLDEQELPAAMWGVATPVDGGEHTVVAERGEETLPRRTVTVEEGATAEVSLDLPAFPSPEILANQQSASGHDEDVEESGGVLSSPWFWVIIGVVVAGGVIAGVALAASGGSEEPFQGNLMTIPIGAGG